MSKGWGFWLPFAMLWVGLGGLSSCCYFCYTMAAELAELFEQTAALGLDPELLSVPDGAEARRAAAYFLALSVLAAVWFAVAVAFPYWCLDLYVREPRAQLLVQAASGASCVACIALAALSAGPAWRWWRFFDQRGAPAGSALIPFLLAVLSAAAAGVVLLKVAHEALLSAVLAGRRGGSPGRSAPRSAGGWGAARAERASSVDLRVMTAQNRGGSYTTTAPCAETITRQSD